MNIFEQFGIEEVADACLYSIELDENDDEIYIPVLYMDTLKVSTFEETASQTSARGGLGNPELIIWDYGKEITVTLTDALYTPASQSMTWGGKLANSKLKILGSYITEEGEELAATFGVDSFSNYSQHYVGGKTYYCWTVNANVISANGLYRYYVEKKKNSEDKISIYYNQEDNTWSFAIDEAATNQILELPKGSFKIKDDLNKHLVPPQECVYQITHGIENVYFLDRIEKCIASQTFVINTDANTKHGNYRYLEQYSECELTVFIDPRTMQPYEPNTDTYTRKNGTVVEGNLRVIKQYEVYYKWTRSKALENTSLGSQIIVDAVHFPGTYRLVGETYTRSRKTGKDQHFQVEIPLCKMGTENNFTLEAGGEPTTFTMTLKVLRREDGQMIKLTQYATSKSKYDGYLSDSTKVIPTDEVVTIDAAQASE